MKNSPTLSASWLPVLADQFTQPYMLQLLIFLQQQQDSGKVVLPEHQHWFAAFNSTPFDRVKVVILGQDPYHALGQAHGLCFSVLPGVKVPPSLVNIFKELHAEFGTPRPDHGCLTSWAQQGVLLLNATLTVEQAAAASHQGRGWEIFTDKAISELSRRREGVVFLLWGGYARKKIKLIDTSKHLVLLAPHPSPLSAYRGFFGCGHFTKANDYLQRRGCSAIDWSLPFKG